jgi:coniferyl-aldehyde dehydrogenase
MAQTASPSVAAETPKGDHAAIAAMRAAFDRLLAAYRREPAPTYEQRLDRLDRLARALRERQDDIAEAVRGDFGNRSVHETRIAEVLMPLDHVRYLRKHLKGWMRPQRRRVSMTYQPARARVHYQPVGVVGIISPWNYPLTLAVSPMAAALAAGNRVLVKPSELTPRTATLLKGLFADIFGPDLVEVVTGGPEVGAAFSRLPLHHLLYTGSTHVGRQVMQAAAENLTPVTLELGGKSPAIVHESYPIGKAASRIAWGKCANSGQTCIAPDYVLAPAAQIDALVEALRERVADSYPTLKDNDDYTCIINDRHYERIRGLIEDAEAKGARRVELNPAGEALGPASRKIPPTVLLDVNDDMKVMREEIFGPVLPVIGYGALAEAIAYVNDRPRPLTLYYFDDDRARVRHVLEQTVSGGAAVNETLLQFGIDDMPFGGVGASGMGAYHGFEGFATFSNPKGVLYQARLNGTGLLAPPYGKLLDRLLGLLIGGR